MKILLLLTLFLGVSTSFADTCGVEKLTYHYKDEYGNPGKESYINVDCFNSESKVTISYRQYVFEDQLDKRANEIKKVLEEKGHKVYLNY